MIQFAELFSTHTLMLIVVGLKALRVHCGFSWVAALAAG